MANVSRGIILNPSSNNATDEGVHLDLTERVGLITQIILTTLIFSINHFTQSVDDFGEENTENFRASPTCSWHV